MEPFRTSKDGSFLKGRRDIPAFRKTVSNIVSHSLETWMVLHGIPGHMLMDIGTMFVRRFIEPLCAFFRTTHLATTAYQRQANEQAEQFSN